MSDEKIIPKKLKHDAIREALFEVRFDPHVHSEVFMGKLIEKWPSAEQTRLPAYDIPQPIREIDPGMRFSPTLQLLDSSQSSSVRIGPFVMSFHRTAPYPGWDVFQRDLHHAIASLFSAVGSKMEVQRLGLRYFNILSVSKHAIKSVGDLDLSVNLEGRRLEKCFHLDLLQKHGAEYASLVRVASRDFLDGDFQEDDTVFADVDVSTPSRPSATTQAGIEAWVNEAHNLEKKDFFSLFSQATIDSWAA